MDLKHLWATISSPRAAPVQRDAELFVRGRKPGDIFILGTLTTLLFVSTLFVVGEIHAGLTEEVAVRGGELDEGILGTPRFGNPLLAVSDADRDLVELVYAGLMTVNKHGELVPELASMYEVSEDGLSYTFTIREDAVFHDGQPVTAEDVVFTVEKAKDPLLKSSKRANWEGVGVQAIDQKTVVFILKEAYAPFLENTTLGILPKHIWGEVTSEEFPFTQFAVEPIGAGPFMIEAVRRNSSGIIRSYELRGFDRYVLGEPYLSKITLSFYPNTDALIRAYERNEVTSAHSIFPEEGVRPSLEEPYSRVFGVFLNQNRNAALKDNAAREALSVAVDRTRIVKDVLGGYGTPLIGPLPSSFETENLSQEERTERARSILVDGGWEWSEETMTWSKDATPLSITIRTGNVQELQNAARIVKESWETLGVATSLELFEASDLQQNVIRPREYEAVYFGLVIPREPDLFAFWHSSQRNDPGLNIALYTNIQTDKLLADARTTTDTEEREELFAAFEEGIENERPAIFTHTPNFVYLAPSDLHGFLSADIVVPSDRFGNVHEWYRRTERVWPIFVVEE